MKPVVTDAFLCPRCGEVVDALAGRQVDASGPVQLWYSCSACAWSGLPTALPRTLVPEDWR